MKSFLFLLAALCLTASSLAAEPLYGVSAEGTYFIHKTLVDKVEGAKPAVMYGPDWSERPMKLEGNYYVFRSGRNIFMKATYCFAIGGSRYLPHALDGLDIAGINPEDVKDNGQGGANFVTSPVRFPG